MALTRSTSLSLPHRAARAYARLALLGFNTLIAVAVAFVVAGKLIPPRNTVPAHLYSGAFHLDSYQLISRKDAIDTGLDFDAMGESEGYAYSPWTTFQESPFSGRLVHVDPGFTSNTRRTAAPTSNGRQPLIVWTSSAQADKVPAKPTSNGRQPLIVWTFGGSTMFGWGMPDDQTIPSHLQDALQQVIPDRQIVVINYGHAYYTSSEETALFSALLRTENKPDVVLFLDGLNDALWFGRGLIEPYFAEIARDGWTKEQSHNYIELFRPGRYAPPMVVPADPAQEIADRYRLNREQRQALAQAFGIDAYFFLQPVTFYGPAAQVSADIPAGAALAYGELDVEHYPGFYSLVGALVGVPHPYVDGAHYSDLASMRLAQHMAERISRRYTIF